MFRTLRRAIAFSLLVHLPWLSSAATPPEGLLNPGQEPSALSLEQAVRMALENNLDVRFNRVEIAIERARMRFAVGAFDPVFSIAASRDSLQRPDFSGNLTSAGELSTLSQSLAIADNTFAIANQTLALQQQTQAIVDQTNALLQVAQALPQGQSNPFFPTPADIQQQQINAEIQRQLLEIQAQLRAAPGFTSPPVSPLDSPFTTSLQQALAGDRVVVFEQESDRIEGALQFRTPIGTIFQFTARQSRTRSTFENDPRDVQPFYEAFGGIELRQPILRNFGTDVNLREVREARVNQKIAQLNWEQTLSEGVQTVMSTYFDMVFGLADVAVKQDAIAADEKLVEQNQRRLDLGFMSPIDVEQARAQVSLDKEAFLASKNFFLERQFAMKRLILDELRRQDQRVFVPIEPPDLPMPKLERTALLAQAFQNRPDYHAALANAEIFDLRLKFARNQILPQLDLVATYGYNGLGDSYSSARDYAWHSQAPQWSVGFQFSVPLGNVQARAQLDAVKGLKEQAVIRIKQQELLVGVEVDTALSRIETNRQRLETARRTRALNDEAVRIALRRLEEGQMSSFDVIEQQRRLYEARSRELAARADLNKAITDLWRATGTVLENMRISIQRSKDVKKDFTAVMGGESAAPTAKESQPAKPTKKTETRKKR